MSRTKQRTRRDPAARKARKAMKRRAELKQRHRGRREVPRGLRTRGQMRQPMTQAINKLGWLQDRREQRRTGKAPVQRQKVA